MPKVLPLLSLTLFGVSQAATTCTTATVQQALKGPVSTTYQIVTKDRTIAGQVIKGKTTVQTNTVKSIPNGVQFTMTEGSKTNVMKMTCVNGKTVMEINGKVMPASAAASQGMDTNFKDLALDFNKHKVGDTWSGKLNSVKTNEMTSESTFVNKILGAEKVTTPAGTFDTYKVEQQISTKMTIANMPKDMKMPNMDSKITTTTWYAKNAPHMIIKSVSDGMTMTLLKYSK